MERERRIDWERERGLAWGVLKTKVGGEWSLTHHTRG
jgi:hypothetical protein